MHEKLLNISNYQRNVNQNYNEVSLHIDQNGHQKKKKKERYKIEKNGGYDHKPYENVYSSI